MAEAKHLAEICSLLATTHAFSSRKVSQVTLAKRRLLPGDVWGSFAFNDSETTEDRTGMPSSLLGGGSRVAPFPDPIAQPVPDFQFDQTVSC